MVGLWAGERWFAPDIKERFLNSSAESFIVRDRYLMALRKGRKPGGDWGKHGRSLCGIKDNASEFDEAMELFNLLQEKMKYRIKQFGKCINATQNHRPAKSNLSE